MGEEKEGRLSKGPAPWSLRVLGAMVRVVLSPWFHVGLAVPLTALANFAERNHSPEWALVLSAAGLGFCVTGFMVTSLDRQWNSG